MPPTPDAAPRFAVQSASRGRAVWWTLGVLLLLGALGWGWQAWRARQTAAPVADAARVAAGGTGGGRFGGGPGAASRITPVVAQAATLGNMPVRLGALGTVTARNTVVVRPQVSGKLLKIEFREGQTVKAGQVLAQIDPSTFQVSLDSAQAQLAKDTAQLAAAEVDLKRYRTLLAQDSIASQQVDTQAAQVSQFKATLAADRAAVAQARLQLGYARVVAPISGRVGFRQVDVGNLVQASDANGLAVITEVQPISVIFPITQQQLPPVLARLNDAAALVVEAWDGDNKKLLASGRLVTVDNQIDVATGTVKLKAEFANTDGALFPNQFVNVRMTVNTLEQVVLVSASAVQQGASGPFVYVARDDDTVTLRPTRIGPGDGVQVAVLRGLAPGDRVVVDGVDRLREGARVQVLAQREVPVAAAASGARRGGRRPEGAASGASAAFDGASGGGKRRERGASAPAGGG